MIGDWDWVCGHWLFSLNYVERVTKNIEPNKNWQVFCLAKDIIEEIENAGGYYP